MKSNNKMKILFLPGSLSSPSARFRIHQFIPYLQKLGYDTHVHIIQPERSGIQVNSRNPIIRRLQGWGITVLQIASLRDVFRDAHRYDVIMMNRDIIPSPRITFLEPILAKRNSRLIFDFDDAIHLTRDKKMRINLPYFSVITPGNENLAAYARKFHNDVRIWPTVIDTDYYYPIQRVQSSKVHIGWSGSVNSGKVDLPIIEPVITRLAKLIDFEFVVISNVDPQISWPGVNIRYIPWTPETEVNGLHQIDIGIMPLEDEPFQRGKCSLKAIQYMGNGIPAVVSPVGANITTVIDKETGFHASKEDEWVEHLLELTANPNLRKRMGVSAREHVILNYSIKSLLPKMIDTFEYVSTL